MRRTNLFFVWTILTLLGLSSVALFGVLGNATQDRSLVATVSARGQEAPLLAWSGWDALDTIVNLAVTDTEGFLTTAAEELQTYLGDMSGRTWLIVETDISGPAIRLKVDPSDASLSGRNDEAVRLLTDDQGIHITGRTPSPFATARISCWRSWGSAGSSRIQIGLSSPTLCRT